MPEVVSAWFLSSVSRAAETLVAFLGSLPLPCNHSAKSARSLSWGGGQGVCTASSCQINTVPCSPVRGEAPSQFVRCRLPLRRPSPAGSDVSRPRALSCHRARDATSCRPLSCRREWQARCRLLRRCSAKRLWIVEITEPDGSLVCLLVEACPVPGIIDSGLSIFQE